VWRCSVRPDADRTLRQKAYPQELSGQRPPARLDPMGPGAPITKTVARRRADPASTSPRRHKSAKNWFRDLQSAGTRRFCQTTISAWWRDRRSRRGDVAQARLDSERAGTVGGAENRSIPTRKLIAACLRHAPPPAPLSDESVLRSTRFETYRSGGFLGRGARVTRAVKTVSLQWPRGAKLGSSDEIPDRQIDVARCIVRDRSR